MKRFRINIRHVDFTLPTGPWVEYKFFDQTLADIKKACVNGLLTYVSWAGETHILNKRVLENAVISLEESDED